MTGFSTMFATKAELLEFLDASLDNHGNIRPGVDQNRLDAAREWVRDGVENLIRRNGIVAVVRAMGTPRAAGCQCAACVAKRMRELERHERTMESLREHFNHDTNIGVVPKPKVGP